MEPTRNMQQPRAALSRFDAVFLFIWPFLMQAESRWRAVLETKEKEEKQILRQKEQGIRVMSAYVQMMSICAVLVIVAPCAGCDLVPFTPVTDPVQRRAVCMDGSPAGYHYAAGSGDGAKNWLVVLMGGGWCSNIDACEANRTTNLGNLYNWNRVYVVYCDQSSFLGDTASDSLGSNLQFRGSRIFDAVVEDLLVKGMGNGDNAILAGRSAGGLAAILHCDDFRGRLPDVERVKCFSDAGFFIRAKNVSNADYREQFFASTIMLHNISSLLPMTCTKRINPSLCLFPEYLVGDVKTPLFLLNSAFDYYQVLYKLVPPNSVDRESWLTCLRNLTNCPDAQELIKDFGEAFLEAIREIPSNPSTGLFIHACFSHVVAFVDKYWAPNSTLKLENRTISEAFSDWFFDRDSVALISPSKYQQSCS